eukprot:TRINITY_DN1740_c0_g1_i1.p1 TRINITY_DN1740_c0_g1~~TRINITY_DN1740_c0_g1_i1.p1  ORF type:complete len:259 (-),score=69.43 TRINITY_DN1740_c0_g1_i1:46-732(-)
MAQKLTSLAELNQTIKEQGGHGLIVLDFWATWCEPCEEMNKVFETLAKKYSEFAKFFLVEAEATGDITEKFTVSSVPVFLFLRGGYLIERLDGANAPELGQKLERQIETQKLLEKSKPLSAEGVSGEELLNARLTKLINSDKIMLFMKGHPTAPRCGFSRTIVQILEEEGAKFSSFDILSDQDVRNGLKTYSNWPTYPQLYVNGKLIGGLDIVKELREEGELKAILNP